MTNVSRLSRELENIKKTLWRKKYHIYQPNDIKQIFHKNKQKWNLPATMNLKKFVDALFQESVIDYCKLTFPSESHFGFVLCSSPANYIIPNLVPETYLSHASALNIWKITTFTERIYLNREQHASSGRQSKRKLIQSAVQAAFNKPQKQTSEISQFRDIPVILLRGKFSDKLGVTQESINSKETAWVTDLERTLIDYVVRPAYAPPPTEMINIFRKAKKNISASLIAGYLKSLDYTYPYHQAIGFYLEKAGNYSDAEISLFASQNMPCDFYLDYQIESPSYSPKWRLFYPPEIDLV